MSARVGLHFADFGGVFTEYQWNNPKKSSVTKTGSVRAASNRGKLINLLLRLQKKKSINMHRHHLNKVITSFGKCVWGTYYNTIRVNYSPGSGLQNKNKIMKLSVD
eukprot:GEMP01076299.1.p1 GENE.GEMP01076299.1~~GEMP01076299.1.p1  ORF type:complete len:106 (-),score=1.02 GEMP01076299.1:622-939(-)